MTRQEVETLLQQMDQLAAFLLSNKLNGAGNCLLDAIDVIDDALDGHQVFVE